MMTMIMTKMTMIVLMMTIMTMMTLMTMIVTMMTMLKTCRQAQQPLPLSPEYQAFNPSISGEQPVVIICNQYEVVRYLITLNSGELKFVIWQIIVIENISNSLDHLTSSTDLGAVSITGSTGNIDLIDH